MFAYLHRKIKCLKQTSLRNFSTTKSRSKKFFLLNLFQPQSTFLVQERKKNIYSNFNCMMYKKNKNWSGKVFSFFWDLNSTHPKKSKAPLPLKPKLKIKNPKKISSISFLNSSVSRESAQNFLFETFFYFSQTEWK